MKNICLLLFLIILSGCVSESEHKKILNENDKLKAEIHELKFGIPNLLKESKKLFSLQDYSSAKSKIELLVQKYPNSIESSEAKKMIPRIEEELLWESINDTDDLGLIKKYKSEYPKGKYSKAVARKRNLIVAGMDKDAFENAKNKNTLMALTSYLEDYPNGRYRTIANNQIATIKKANEKNAYQNAKVKNSSFTWESFLMDYPNHWDKTNIKKRIISLKVDEIIGDSNTGKLPSFSQTDYGYSSTSSVTIDNDTGRLLTVRYSGPSVKEIVIPIGSSRTTSLISGSYKIAASAGELHYAGREQLSGNYSSSYYISTTRY